ncbi:MAG TPA: alpha/beta hydrolase [Clostridiales bacterium]|nr:alpha/beta hydrolase [Clostridiales bacterium]
MAGFNEFRFTSANGKTEIYACRWEPEGHPRGIIQISHGMAEHIARYDHFAKYLNNKGFVVVGNDHLGHGKSAVNESELGYFGETGGWNFVVADMHKLRELTSKEYPDLPYFLLGHSMGSFLVRTCIIRYRNGISGVILSGTGQQRKAVIRAGEVVARAEVKKKGAKYRSQKLNDLVFGNYNEGFTYVRTVYDWLSRDEAQVAKYMKDPLCGYMPTAGLFRDMLGGLKYISSTRNLKRMKKDLPVFFISGDSDPVGENGRGVIRAYRHFLKAGMTDVTLKMYPEGRHEMLNEINRDEVYEDILTWIESKLKK